MAAGNYIYIKSDGSFDVGKYTADLNGELRGKGT